MRCRRAECGAEGSVAGLVQGATSLPKNAVPRSASSRRGVSTRRLLRSATLPRVTTGDNEKGSPALRSSSPVSRRAPTSGQSREHRQRRRRRPTLRVLELRRRRAEQHLVAGALPTDPSGRRAHGYLQTQGEARWFKLPILPNGRVDIALMNLPADYDLVIFSDIQAAYDALAAGATRRRRRAGPRAERPHQAGCRRPGRWLQHLAVQPLVVGPDQLGPDPQLGRLQCVAVERVAVDASQWSPSQWSRRRSGARRSGVPSQWSASQWSASQWSRVAVECRRSGVASQWSASQWSGTDPQLVLSAPRRRACSRSRRSTGNGAEIVVGQHLEQHRLHLHPRAGQERALRSDPALHADASVPDTLVCGVTAASSPPAPATTGARRPRTR